MNRPLNIDCTLLCSITQLPILIPPIEHIVIFSNNISFFMNIPNASVLKEIYYQSDRGFLILTNLRLIYISHLVFLDIDEYNKIKDIKKFKTFYVGLDKVFSVELNDLRVQLNNDTYVNLNLQFCNPICGKRDDYSFIECDSNINMSGGGSNKEAFVSLLKHYLRRLDPFLGEIGNQKDLICNKDMYELYNKFFDL
ncbi:hypothetical protein CDIK_2395 [Cucumispora dikerogammari]|nr:hypothetical protein CDIK_2395 [Cucumispora dikerogammari]